MTKNTPLTFEAFEKMYRETFAQMMAYSLEQVGSAVYCDKLAALAEAYPEWTEVVENSKEAR